MTDRTWDQAQFEQAQANGQRLDAVNAQLAQIGVALERIRNLLAIICGVVLVAGVFGGLAILGS